MSELQCGCITCGDEALPMRVRRTVSLGLLPDAGIPGDWVLIHVGFALSKVDEAEAMATLRLLEQMGAEYEQELDELKASAIE